MQRTIRGLRTADIRSVVEIGILSHLGTRPNSQQHAGRARFIGNTPSCCTHERTESPLHSWHTGIDAGNETVKVDKRIVANTIDACNTSPYGQRRGRQYVLFFAHHFPCPPRSTTRTSSMSATGEKGKEDYGQETALGGTSSDQVAVRHS